MTLASMPRIVAQLRSQLARGKGLLAQRRLRRCRWAGARGVAAPRVRSLGTGSLPKLAALSPLPLSRLQPTLARDAEPTLRQAPRMRSCQTAESAVSSVRVFSASLVRSGLIEPGVSSPSPKLKAGAGRGRSLARKGRFARLPAVRLSGTADARVWGTGRRPWLPRSNFHLKFQMKVAPLGNLRPRSRPAAPRQENS